MVKATLLLVAESNENVRVKDEATSATDKVASTAALRTTVVRRFIQESDFQVVPPAAEQPKPIFADGKKEYPMPRMETETDPETRTLNLETLRTTCESQLRARVRQPDIS